MYQHNCSHFILCLLGTMFLFHLLSAAAIGQLPKALDIEQDESIQLHPGKEENTGLLSDILNARQFVHGNVHTPDVPTRSKRSRNDWADLDDDIEVKGEDNDSVGDHNEREMTSELDRAIESYVARFYSDLLELIHTEMREQVPHKPKHSNKNHKKLRRKTRPKRSVGSFAFQKNDGLKW